MEEAGVLPDRLRGPLQHLSASRDLVKALDVTSVRDSRFTPPPDLPERYQLVKRLGEGGTAVVYLAQDKILCRDVVLKFLSNPSLPPDLAEEYFRREAVIVAGLSHPNIVQVYDVGSAGGRQYMVIEYIDGLTLEEELDAAPDRILPIERVATVATDLGEALAYAHERKVIHRDVKPSNVMALRDGHVKLMDFGMAKALEIHTDRSIYICGTPDYMSPEQESGYDLTSATDIYSFALVVLESLTGRLPLGGSPQATRHARLHVLDNSGLHDEVRRILARCLSLDTESRPPSARLVAQALRQACR